ncbi:MAG: hypothetical protein KA215_02055 [Flavobacterium sp.]|jgi:hypothetical protein|nr:hypothetical protein [Flavobacterium sp.]HQV34945.1 hypothetical protein [Flavobacterium sp.]HQX02834.1 hypothetical protein [Flavobacterium sp.]
MKKRILTAIICCFTSISFAQLVQGELKVKEQSKLELTVSSNKAVNLYADFRENKYPIQFAFTGNSIPVNSDKKVVVQFVFTTTVKKDGKVIGTTKRNPIPFFPGDMFMPVETFDFISILSNLQNNSEDNISEILKGNYEILLEAKPINMKGEIASARLFLKI